MTAVVPLEESVSKKRGRKAADSVDSTIKEKRTRTPRGIPHLLSMAIRNDIAEYIMACPNDKFVNEILEREQNVIRNRELIEMREVPLDDDGTSLGGSPVSTRLLLPPASVAKCIKHAMEQIQHFDMESNRESQETNFTPEVHVILSKACEEFVIEMVSRAYLDAMQTGTPHFVSDANLKRSVRNAWKSDACYPSYGSLDFLIDRVDRSGETSCDPLDSITRIHRGR